jgi:hypothetical protein
MATWNACSMLQPVKMQEVAKEMICYKVDFMSLQEMRWKGNGRIDRPEFPIICSESEKNQRVWNKVYNSKKNERKYAGILYISYRMV